MVTSTEDKVLENRLRRMAVRQGLQLRKWRARDPRAIGYGCYALIDPYTNSIVAGVGLTGRYEFDLSDVEGWLTQDR